MKQFGKSHLILLVVLGGITLTTVFATGTIVPFTPPYQLNDTANNAVRLYVDNSGSVGIGTTNPNYKLDVNGNAHIGNDLSLTRTDTFHIGSIVVDNSTTDTISLSKLGGGNINQILLWAKTLYASGNVGIGTSTPGSKLDVNGNAHIGNDLSLTRSDNFSSASIVVDNSMTTGIVLQKSGGGNINNIVLSAKTVTTGGNITTASTNKELKISAPSGIPICIGSGC